MQRTSSFKQPLSVWMRERRAILGKTIVEMARLINCDAETLEELELDYRLDPSLSLYKAVCRHYGIDCRRVANFDDDYAIRDEA